MISMILTREQDFFNLLIFRQVLVQTHDVRGAALNEDCCDTRVTTALSVIG